MNKAISVNSLAWKLLDKLIENAALYRVNETKAENGATIIDAGIEAEGGFQAGKLITEICMGGCGKAKIAYRKYGDFELPSISVDTDNPIIATLGSQYAGWQIKEDGYFAIGSGPARALALKPKKIYDEIGYKDDFDKAVVVLETEKRPPTETLEQIARDCKVPNEDLAVILTPTTSVAGSTQVAGRIVETGIHKLRRIGFDPNKIQHAWGVAPIPPVHPKFANAMSRTNDAILYGGTTYYVLEYENEEELVRILKEAPSELSRDYGRPFIEIFKEARCDFYKVDPNLFAPAVMIVNNTLTGNTYRNGNINTKLLAESFGIKAI
jgi:methenyltetrahydromethanopterin cyclohydrolase